MVFKFQVQFFYNNQYKNQHNKPEQVKRIWTMHIDRLSSVQIMPAGLRFMHYTVILMHVLMRMYLAPYNPYWAWLVQIRQNYQLYASYMFATQLDWEYLNICGWVCPLVVLVFVLSSHHDDATMTPQCRWQHSQIDCLLFRSCRRHSRIGCFLLWLPWGVILVLSLFYWKCDSSASPCFLKFNSLITTSTKVNTANLNKSCIHQQCQKL